VPIASAAVFSTLPCVASAVLFFMVKKPFFLDGFHF
jgi:hypothetical protein